MLNRLRAILADFFRQADLVLLSLCCVSTIFGIVLIFSATRYKHDARYVIIQSAALLLGICVYIACSMLDLEVLMKRWKWILAFNVGFILLLRTRLGKDVGGNRAWLRIPGIPINIGPAEVVKITFVLLLAWQLTWLLEEKRDLHSFRSAAFTAAHALGLCVLYFLVSSDMGNGLVFLFIFLCMAFVAGFALRWFVLLLGGSAAAVAAAWKLGLMPEYMQKRFRVLFDHSYDPTGAGWQQTRSLLQPADPGLRRRVRPGVSGRHPDTEPVQHLPPRPVDRLYLLRLRRGIGDAGLHRCPGASGGCNPPGPPGGPERPDPLLPLYLRGYGRHADLPDHHQCGDVPVRHAGHRHHPPLLQLRRLFHRNAVRRHGHRLRHQEKDAGHPPARTASAVRILPGAA